MKSAIRILKADEVEVSGTYALDRSQSPGQALHEPPEGRALGAPQVQIVEQHPQYALLEITCACGHTLQVKCDYEQAMAVS